MYATRRHALVYQRRSLRVTVVKKDCLRGVVYLMEKKGILASDCDFFKKASKTVCSSSVNISKLNEPMSEHIVMGAVERRLRKAFRRLGDGELRSELLRHGRSVSKDLFLQCLRTYRQNKAKRQGESTSQLRKTPMLTPYRKTTT